MDEERAVKFEKQFNKQRDSKVPAVGDDLRRRFRSYGGGDG